jgi:hypothetical protein
MKKLLKTLLCTSLYLLERSDGAQKGRNRKSQPRPLLVRLAKLFSVAPSVAQTKVTRT